MPYHPTRSTYRTDAKREVRSFQWAFPPEDIVSLVVEQANVVYNTRPDGLAELDSTVDSDDEENDSFKELRKSLNEGALRLINLGCGTFKIGEDLQDANTPDSDGLEPRSITYIQSDVLDSRSVLRNVDEQTGGKGEDLIFDQSVANKISKGPTDFHVVAGD